MEKLINLLNDYCGEDEGSETKWTDKHFGGLLELQIISKKFGFIKWLVENDKIDKDNEELISLMSELGEFEQYEKCLLMLLSIQDEPIKFLCEILK